MTKRRLTDLFVVGRELALDDGAGDPVIIWLQKLNLVEQTEASRWADAARARTLSLRSTKEHPDWVALSVQAFDVGGHTALVDFLEAEEEAGVRQLAEAQLADEDEWKKDNYLTGLRDVWTGTLEMTWAQDPTDAEAARVHGELERFVTTVNEMVAHDMEAVRDTLNGQSDDELRDQVTEKLLELAATRRWLDEFYRYQLYFGSRDPEKHKVRYFADRAEVDQLAPDTYRRLREAFEGLEVDIMEGKGSAGIPPSSPSSEQPADSATEDSSGLLVAMA